MKYSSSVDFALIQIMIDILLSNIKSNFQMVEEEGHMSLYNVRIMFLIKEHIVLFIIRGPQF